MPPYGPKVPYTFAYLDCGNHCKDVSSILVFSVLL